MELSRRNFLKSAVAVAGAAGVGALASTSVARADVADDAGVVTYDQTIAWDAVYDVVVIGFGAAGSSTSIAAADAGASVLLLEKAPLGNEGGNSRLCGQMFAYGQDDPEEALSYYTKMAGELTIPDEILEVYTQGVAVSAHTYAEVFELDESNFADTANYMSPEYPEFVTNEETEVQLWKLHGTTSDSYMWQNWRKQVLNRSDSIDVWLESPAVALIQEPNTKTVIGVKVERAGETLNIRATNGVALTCGGYENNRQMIMDYLGWARTAYQGTGYNTGDGIKMAMAAGGDLWHMDVIEGGTFTYVTYLDKAIENHRLSTTGAGIIVGGDGYRFHDEGETTRHGHRYYNGTWDILHMPSRMYVIFDSADTAAAHATYADVYESDTIAGLAELIGADPDILQQTIDEFNFFCEAGVDYAYHRDIDTMEAFGDGPYYAVEAIPSILNTQGGPRRNENAEIVDADGNAIPHLYAAGECGGITSNHYQGGSNMAECLIFGRIAGTNAAAEKDSLDEYVAEVDESTLTIFPGDMNDIVDTSNVEAYEAECADNEYIGAATGMGGELVVKVTTDDGETIIGLEVLEDYETEGLGGAAIEVLVPAILELGTTDGVDNVSGATVTTSALIEAIADALAKAAE